ncbi:hypothetical protein ACHAQA_003100 [Verticillium albo-atrum]
MSSPDNTAGASDNIAPVSGSSSRKSSRGKRAGHHTSQDSAPGTSGSSRRTKRNTANNAADQDTAMTGTDDDNKDDIPPPPPPPPEVHPDDDDSDENDENDEDEMARYDDEDDDPFGGFGGPGVPSGLSSTLRALTGMMSGLSSRLRDLLSQLRQKEDPSMQLIALQELSEILLVSNEDNLSGHFSPDSFVKELVTLMQPNEITGEENPEIMLLACRSLANLMEALPASVANVVYGGAVPVLCQKLLEISFIDLAEQALSTLEKISAEYPSSIVREGGLTACLSYLDFFATSTQRTAVTTAANCCRNIPEDSFSVIKDVMPTLLNVLNSNDQRVVEQASLCVSGIVESFKYQSSKLEELVSVDLLKVVLRLLVPGTTNLIGPSIHTQFLRVLAFTARSSPRLSAELFKLNIVETLYQILTGVSPPSGTEDVASKLDSVVIMQALIHRPREQIIETLNVICELLPSLPRNADPSYGDFVEMTATEPITPSSTAPGKARKTPNDKRVELLGECQDEVRRFALILFPTLTDAYSSTVNLNVRQKVLTAQLKMLSNLDEKILGESLRTVPYASFLASILSQQDHPSLVMLGLQATELLLNRLDDVYRYQMYREGVISEIAKLAAQEIPLAEASPASTTHTPEPAEPEVQAEAEHQSSDNDESDDGDDGDDAEEDDQEGSENEDDEDDDEDNENERHPDDGSGSPVSSRGSTMSLDGAPTAYLGDGQSMRTRIRDVAKKFIETHDTEKQGRTMKKKAIKVLTNLSTLAEEIEAFYLHRTSGLVPADKGTELFEKLVSYFDAEVLESVTSAELLASGLVRVLLAVFSNPNEELARAAQSTFLRVFMGFTVKAKLKTATADSPATPFSVMIHKLQDLLSRSEHFEVITVHHNTFDHRSSAASMLAKQIRLRLVADDDSEIPRPYRNIMVSIHAIATFKSLDDYLRPRLSLSERGPRGSRRADGISRALAAMAGAGTLPGGLSSFTQAAAARFAAERAAAASSSGPPPPAPAASTPSSSRAMRKTKSKALQQSDAPSTPDPASAAREKGVLRRSARRSGGASAETPQPTKPVDDDDDLQDALECADEKQLTDDDDIGGSSALDAIVGELEDDMDDAPMDDPGAVNLEVAAGGKVTAREEDGTRIPTPAQTGSGLPTRASGPPAPASQQASTPSASRLMSYAAAIQSVPQDWHIEFSLDGKTLPSETTIYRAVHTSASNSDEHLSRSIWSAVHPIKFRRAPGPPPPDSGSTFGGKLESSAEENGDGIPASLAKHPATSSILRLLNLLHDLNANVEDVLVENKDTVRLNVEPLSQFVNTKLTAKLNRQLEEPLVVASNCLPSWAEDLATLYPFLFPFETRHLFLQSTSFGYARSMTRWQNAQSVEESRRDRNERPFLGRLQRQKVRISRSKILESALKVMELYGASQSILEVEYFEEVGTGLGPTLEFYSTVSKEFSKKKLKLWREMDSLDEEYISGASGLFPRPLSDDEATAANGNRICQLFKILGKFVARSMIDSRIIDLNFNPIFFRISDAASIAGVKPSLGAVKVVDPGLARSLKTIKKFSIAKKEIDEDPSRTPAQKVADTEAIVIDDVRLEDLCLDFTLPGYPEIELVANGSHVRVTMDNVDSYLDRVIDMTLGSGVRRQVDAFRAGFSQVFPYSALSAFTPDELVSLFGRVDEDWSLETLMDSIKADHGYNMDSKSVRNLLQTMSELTPNERRDFLQFTTGSPKLPIGGFKSLTPMFTVVCKPSEAPFTSDDYLPSVMTCVNYLKLPDYTNLDIMHEDALDQQPFDLPAWEPQSDLNLWWPPSVEYLESSTNTYGTSWDIADAQRRSQAKAAESNNAPSARPIYGALQGRQMRVLELSPGRPQDPIHIELQTVDLFHKPDYEAVSYTWANLEGDSRRSKTVYVGPRWAILRVTENCDSMLRRVRFEEYPRPLWVDAICINQGNTLERSHQVGIMRDIYASASSVLIFLEGITDKDKGKITYSPQRARPFNKTQSYWQAPAEFSALVQALCSRPYFSRIWIIQEIAAARQAQVVFGPHICGWEQFHAVARHLPAVPWLKHFDRPRFRDNDKLCDLLMDTAGNLAGDPRDRVFALLGLISGPAADGLEPDYNLDLRHVLVGITAYHLTKHPAFAWRIFSAASKRRLHGLPSWVPDWSGKGDLGLESAQQITPSMTSPGFKRSCSVDRRTGSLLLTVRHVMTLPRTGGKEEEAGTPAGPRNEKEVLSESADADDDYDGLYFIPSFAFYLVLRKALDERTYTLVRPFQLREDAIAKYQAEAAGFSPQMPSDAPQQFLTRLISDLLDASEAVGHDYSSVGSENPWATLNLLWQAVRNTAAADADLRTRLLFRKAILVRASCTCTFRPDDPLCHRCQQHLSLDVEARLLAHFDRVLARARAIRTLTSHAWPSWMDPDQKRQLLGIESPWAEPLSLRPQHGESDAEAEVEAERYLPLYHTALVSLLQDPDAQPFRWWSGVAGARAKTSFLRCAQGFLRDLAAAEDTSLAFERDDLVAACYGTDVELAPLLRARAESWRELGAGVLALGASPRELEEEAVRECEPWVREPPTQEVWIR